MNEIIIYRTSYCPYCDMAARLLDNIGVEYEQIDITDDPETRQELVKRTGGKRTVPQIFINGQSIGGYTDLQALQSSGQLAEMLAADES